MDAEELRRHWDERYTRFPDALDGDPPEPVRAFAARLRGRIQPGLPVLVLADGTGRDSVFLAQQGFQALGVELSPVAVDLARRRADVVTAAAVDHPSRLAANWPGARIERAGERLLCHR